MSEVRVRIDVDEAIRILEEVVRSKGTAYVQPTCVHFDGPNGDTPICIAGHAMRAAGYTGGQGGVGTFMDSTTQASLTEQGIELTDGALGVWHQAQSLADSFETWGYVLESVKRNFRG